MFSRIPSFLLGIILSLIISVPGASAASSSLLSQTPLFVSEAVPPLVMLVLGKDHSLFFEAYTDSSDLDGDGVLDLQFKPSIQYYGLFDSTLCYTQTGGNANTGVFTPSSIAGSNYTCSGSWSGNWLNYITTSRVDALRKVLYGGYREVDTAKSTILRRAYIPQDGHSWAKEYTSTSVNGYDITKYTPLSQPTTGRRHFFGNVTMAAGTNCATLDNCSNLPPFLSVVTNSTARVWDWASSESPVLNDSTHKGTRTNYTVRVAVCTANFHDNDCKNYSGNYKPTGLLHQYVDGSMLFGLLTGSYDQNMSGGVLRKVVSNFANEVDTSTGVFTTSNTIVSNLNKLRIRDYQNGRTNSYYRNGSYRTGIMQQGDYVDWGNPIGEMMYEALRYLAGKGSATAAFTTSSTHDNAVGLTRATWDNPYASGSTAQAKSCAKPNMLVMSNVNTSYDSDQLPGSYFGSFSSDLKDLDVSTQASAITASEGDIAGKSFFIGQSGTENDYAPTAKTVTSLAQARGLSPAEPTKQGSFYPASVARFAANTVVNSSSDQKTDTYVVALASPLPTFEFTVGNRTISLAPFAKTINGSSADKTKGKYQPTDAIVDLYVESYSSSGAKFRINYEADEQGNDFDSDVIVEYNIVVNSNNTLTVTVTPTAQSTGSNQNLGYAISGTSRDGVYLVVQDKQNSLPYFLNVPPGRNAGYCNVTTMPSDCGQLPWINGTGTINGSPASYSTQTFSASSTAAETLNSPLWYAAKYGIAGRNTSSITGDPDNYFLVTNASALKSQLETAFNKIQQVNNSVTSPTVSTQSAQDNSTSDSTYTYTTSFNVDGWTGDLKKTNIATSEVVWQAASQLRASGRSIYFGNADGEIASFTWNNLSTAQQALLNRNAAGTVDSQGQARVNFIRGSNTSFRSRSSLLGDIVNSSPLLVTGADYDIARADNLEGSSNYESFKSSQDHSVIYVGANDGMLHAFDAETGSELFAFVPKAVIANLPVLTASDYGEEDGTGHQYFVDGSPVARDVYFNGNWHKVLLGSLGAGGREVFALDVTDPEAPELLWEFTNEDDADMGYSVPKPNIARLHNGKWVALIPNGYESGNSLKVVLFVVDIETGELLSKLEATPTLNSGESATSLGNGLSRITDSDFNGDGIADYAYAGDLLGNLWRFDLINTGASEPLATDATADDDDFAASFGGKPLYVARDAAGTRQAITAAPTLLKHPTGTGYLAIFGTGRYLSNTDKTSDSQQSLYAIWDRKTAGESSSSSLTMSKTRASLVEQEITQTTFNSSTVFNVSDNAITWYDGDGTADGNVSSWGWYLDFIQTGERLIYNMSLYGNTLVLSTITPDDNACSAGMTGTIYGLNPRTGGATRYNTFDLDGDGTYDAYAGFVNDGGDFSLSDGKVYYNDNDGSSGTDSKELNAGVSEGRQTWRQLTTEEE